DLVNKMETIFGIHHDTASLREKNDIIQKSKSKDVILDGVNEKNEKNIIKKPSVDKSLDKFNNNNPTTTLQSLLRFARSPNLSPHSTPHSTPPTSRPAFGAPGAVVKEIFWPGVVVVAKSEFDDSICKAEMCIAPGAPNALRQRLPPPINTISTTSSSTSQSLNAKHLTPSSKLTTLIDGTGWTNLEDIVKDNVEYSVDGNNENQRKRLGLNQ
ncbi:7577_t:CDS:2, partial [Entrophospora sp. SA101]